MFTNFTRQFRPVLHIPGFRSVKFFTSVHVTVGKLWMGYLSDSNNPHKFITVGLWLAALVNSIFGAATITKLPPALWAPESVRVGRHPVLA